MCYLLLARTGLLQVREVRENIYLCQGKPGNVRQFGPISGNVREIWGIIYYKKNLRLIPPDKRFQALRMKHLISKVHIRDK